MTDQMVRACTAAKQLLAGQCRSAGESMDVVRTGTSVGSKMWQGRVWKMFGLI